MLNPVLMCRLAMLARSSKEIILCTGQQFLSICRHEGKQGDHPRLELDYLCVMIYVPA